MGYIYCISNKINNKKYIGQTIEKDIYERWKSHLKKSSNCRYLKHAFQKYGKDNFNFEIICICFDNDCDKYEEEYMKKFNTIVPNGYNLREAGNYGHHNEETKKKIGKSISLYYSRLSNEQKQIIFNKKRGENNPNYGKKMSPEIKEKMIKNIKNKKKVNCYNLENELIATFESVSDAAKAVNCKNGTNISHCCLEKYKNCKTAYGFIWKYVE
jgi:group I intron endonuclease